jgi:hypothetical protein
VTLLLLVRYCAVNISAVSNESLYFHKYSVLLLRCYLKNGHKIKQFQNNRFKKTLPQELCGLAEKQLFGTQKELQMACARDHSMQWDTAVILFS